MVLLEVEKVTVAHGLLTAVRDLSLRMGEGECLALVGANGAGKTTLMRCLAGAHPQRSGRVLLDGEDLAGVPAHRRVARGVSLVPEGRRLFPELTVRENLEVAARRGRPGPWSLTSVVEALPLLASQLDKRAGSLSGGQQQAAAIARALVTNPRLLLLDEVSLGLAPAAVDQVYASLEHVMKAGTTMILVEQDLQRAMAVASRLVCMLEGRAVLEGRPADLTRRQVTDAYFGLGHDTTSSGPEGELA